MRRKTRIERRKLLRGWHKWAVLPVIVFAVLFADAWLNIQVRYKDYELNRLSNKRQRLDGELDKVRAREAQLSGVDHLSAIAERLELAAPRSQQFRSVAYREVPRRTSVMELANTETPSPALVVIDLEESPAIRLAQKREAPRESIVTPRAPVMLTPITPPRKDTFEEVKTAYYDNPVEARPSASLKPYEEAMDIYEDTENSLLTVEDMLARL